MKSARNFSRGLRAIQSLRPLRVDIAKLSVGGFVVPHIEVGKHDSPNVMPHIENLNLDLIVFGGTRIIRGDILDFPQRRRS